MNELTLEVQEREKKNKNANRRLRAAGQVPAVVYGGGRDPVAIKVGRRTVEDLLRHTSDNAIFLLKLGDSGKSRHAIIRELETDPITGQMIHIDFQRILMDQKLRLTVAVEVVGTPVGVKTDGGILDFVTRELEITCLPGNIPEAFVVDVSKLHIGQHIEAKDIEFPDGVTLEDDPERVIAAVAQPRQVIEEEEAEEDAALLEAESEEPEVIGKGKDEESED